MVRSLETPPAERKAAERARRRAQPWGYPAERAAAYGAAVAALWRELPDDVRNRLIGHAAANLHRASTEKARRSLDEVRLALEIHAHTHWT